MSKSSTSILLRAAALSSLLIVPGLAACASDDSRIAMSGTVGGSSQPAPVWLHSVPNPDSAYGPVNMNVAH
jgi:hypothetical protein